ncbi:HAMP domain-containing methyl-accepting chemotaxis protein [Azotosporobacter soli]|uniref:methyl-accepting chemotaxis protein n=1 Tax=Azotosporobacter soli TaxID=3055040 RepID=UPI0031FE8B42
MKIQTRLILSNLLVFAIILLVVGMSLYGLGEIRQQYQSINDDNNTSIILLREIQFYYTGQANDERGALLTKQPEFRQEILLKSDQIKKRLAQLQPLMLIAEEKKFFTAINDSHSQFTALNLRVLDLAFAGKQSEAQQLSFNEGRKARKDLETVFNSLVDLQLQQKELGIQSATATFNALRFLMLGAALLALLISLGFGYYTTRKIVKPILQVSGYMARGDLNFSQLPQSNDEIGVLTRSFASLVDQLRNMVLGVQQNAEHVAETANHLSSNANQSAEASQLVANSIEDVAHGAQEQGSRIHSTSKQIEYLSATLQQTAHTVQDIAAVAEESSSSVKLGNQAVDDAINRMSLLEGTVNNSSLAIETLGEQSAKIDQIVAAISGIAAQTNLLALNAAIEAARAGEVGRGFAVVADEVRKLAEQSSDAAKEIAELIHEIQSGTAAAIQAMRQGTAAVGQSAAAVNNAGSAFEEIARRTVIMTERLQNISADVEEVSAISQEVIQAVREIDSIGQLTAQQTETVSAATEEQSASIQDISHLCQQMHTMSAELQQAIKHFRV